jgi:hypothetical protein
MLENSGFFHKLDTKLSWQQNLTYAREIGFLAVYVSVLYYLSKIRRNLKHFWPQGFHQRIGGPK